MSLRTLRTYARIAGRDATNLARYRRSAPRYGERAWIDPRRCEMAHTGHGRAHSARVLPGDWDLDVVPVDAIAKVRACREHFERGVSWEETGIIDHLLEHIRTHGPIDGCSSREELRARYDRVDELFAVVAKEGRLRTRAELGQRFREVGGVYVHIGRHGEPLFGAGGCHRFAIAQILGLERIPVMVGVVHPRALQHDGSPFERAR